MCRDMGPRKYMSVMVFSCLFLDILWCNGCWEQEKIALLQLKEFFDYSEDPLSWNKSNDQSTSDCCKWRRIKCNLATGRVIKLSLNDDSRGWYFSELYLNASYFLPFEELRILDLSNNQIDGYLEKEGFERLSRLNGLEFLDLSGNMFNNSLISSLGNLSSLKVLNLSANLLSGTINTQELKALTNLEELDVGYNYIEEFVGHEGIFSSLKVLHLTGHALNRPINLRELVKLGAMEELVLSDSVLHKDFLQSIGSLTSLRILHLDNCNLKGNLPSQGWCELKNLQELYLNGNKLEGTLPWCLANLSSLRVLDLSDNKFTGNIASTSIRRLVSIELLWLDYNYFQIPISFEPFSNYTNLNFFYGNDNELTTDHSSKSWTPKFQLQDLSLSNCALHHSITKLPDFLYYQYNLRYVDLLNNNFGGVLPSWLLENNTRLEVFSLSNNSYTGIFPLPSHLNQNFLFLDISNNRLQGQIPPNLSTVFPHLHVLSASNNALQGNIPHSFREIKSLQFLDLSNNQLSGQIPQRFFEQQSSLDVLALSNNILSGPIFPTNFSSTTFSALKLDGNKLEGEIPDLSSLEDLTLLDISNNLVSGKLPKSMANLSYLGYINLANNNLEGPIPLELCQLYLLETIILSENNFFGSIPSCLIENFRHVHLNKNKLTGLMPHAFMNKSDLITLDLGNNNFTGTIPNWIGNLSLLGALLLQGNHFHGEIPTTLCQLNGLIILDLSSNGLSGHLPPCLSNFSLTTRDELSNEVIFLYDLRQYIREMVEFTSKGNSLPYIGKILYTQEVVEFISKRNSLPYTGENLENMYGIYLSCNHFTGEIPVEFGNLSNVRGLNLSHNNLTGPIPTSFLNLKQLESLDLSHNDLNGRIPYQLIELNSLEVFSVAYNNLSGPLPDMKAQFGTFDERSYEGNPYLCGPLLINSCDKTNPTSPNYDYSHKDNEDNGCMDIYDFYMSFVASYVVVLLATTIVLWINPYWRQRWFYTIEMISTKCYYFIVDMFY